MKKKYYILLIIGLCLFDQLSKLIILKFFDVNESLVLIKNFLKIYYIQNIGISFGIFSGMRIPIIVLSILIIGYMIYEFIKSEKRVSLISISLIISGAFGNLIDRVFRGYVVDFISFTLFKKEMSIFNLADTFITIGVFIYIISLFMEGKYERVNSK